MNILTIVVLLVLAVFALNGYMRGFVRTLASMFFFLLAAVMVYYATPYVSDFLRTSTPVYEMVEEKCEKLLENVNFENEGKISKKEQAAQIDALALPEVFREQLKASNNQAAWERLAADSFRQYLSKYLAVQILNILIYLLTFLLVSILLRMIIMTLDIITKLPLLHGLNQVLGLFLGTAQGIMVVWIAFLVITVFARTQAGAELMRMVQESEILRRLYDANLFLKCLFGLGIKT